MTDELDKAIDRGIARIKEIEDAQDVQSALIELLEAMRPEKEPEQLIRFGSLFCDNYKPKPQDIDTREVLHDTIKAQEEYITRLENENEKLKCAEPQDPKAICEGCGEYNKDCLCEGIPVKEVFDEVRLEKICNDVHGVEYLTDEADKTMADLLRNNNKVLASVIYNLVRTNDR